MGNRLDSLNVGEEFAKRVATLPQVDTVVSSACIATPKFEILEDSESMVIVNVINTITLILLPAPILQVSALKWDIVPVISVVGSSIHSWTKFPAWKSPNILEAIKRNKDLSVKGRCSPLLCLEHARLTYVDAQFRS
jgi:hypothetical protein